MEVNCLRTGIPLFERLDECLKKLSIAPWFCVRKAEECLLFSDKAIFFLNMLQYGLF